MKSTLGFKYTEIPFNCFSTIVFIEFDIDLYTNSICRPSSGAVIFQKFLVKNNVIRMHLHTNNFHLLQCMDILNQSYISSYTKYVHCLLPLI
jgi:hypothetical protein